MKTMAKGAVMMGLVLAAVALTASVALANGGPFVIKYPEGDPAAKGVLARIGQDLKPRRETELRVIGEDLKIAFTTDPRRGQHAGPALAQVTAVYTIENPTDKEINIDFGFPILRGIYMNPFRMTPSPDATVRVGKKLVRPTIISNSAIYGIIRQRARETIDKAIAADEELSDLVAAVKAGGKDIDAARAALAKYLTRKLKWNKRDAALMVEYASLEFAKLKSRPRDWNGIVWSSGQFAATALVRRNMGALSAIGEQKATQFFAQLASRFDAKAGAGYEAIFTAWGGDVRERSIDLKTGKLRPREITVKPNGSDEDKRILRTEPTLYARVDYLDPNAKITEAERASCKAVLKNLPVVFTFAPMNLLHYQVKFPPKATQTVTVEYKQYAFIDTRAPRSYQLAYVVHPASLWDSFGPIRLEVAVPERVRFRASVACKRAGKEQVKLTKSTKWTCDVYRTTLAKKTGDLLVAIDAAAWDKAVKRAAEKKTAAAP